MLERALLVTAIAMLGCGDGAPTAGVSPTAVVTSSSEISQPASPATTTIRLRRGSIGQEPANGWIDIEGRRGFSLIGGFDSVWGGLRICSDDYAACAPGATLAFSLYRTGNDIGATATLDGVTYTNVGGNASDQHAGFDVRATVVFPRFRQRATAIVTAPCTITGYLAGGGVSETFSALGRLKMWIHQQHEVGDGYWWIDRVECRVLHG
jgi:hypothetical protein